ncbi:uncharacterized protein An03g03120 [Aspergillus niger]|uniref:Contig An03c0100, genomic contig n=2 Tax=Aspergillus niger TaxID=5061 RepID=A2QGG9_ASPNC|nr:uncharacterized protein An03g03120 [Aspergillus niger]CAK44611.1 unnamed protein product [Aspergillus niger]
MRDRTGTTDNPARICCQEGRSELLAFSFSKMEPALDLIPRPPPLLLQVNGTVLPDTGITTYAL